MALLQLPAIFVTLFVSLTVLTALVPQANYQATSSCSDQRNQESELEEAKLRIERLESVLEERLGQINEKTQYFGDCEKKIGELTAEIDRLKASFLDFEQDYSRANLKHSAIEEEVRLLWSASRKNNFEIYALEHKAIEAEKRLNEVASQVEKVAEIVSEQWIQIQRLEQAVYMAEMRTSKIRKELWRRCPFVKFFITLYGYVLKTLKRIMDPYVPMLVSCKSRAFQTFEAAKHYHHQLQGYVKHAMKSNELTAALAHEEFVFFVVSALVAFPLMTACMILLS